MIVTGPARTSGTEVSQVKPNVTAMKTATALPSRGVAMAFSADASSLLPGILLYPRPV
jgi:hypothetical protein